MNFKKILIILVTFLMSINTWALGMPQWVKHLPKATNDSYYYRVTKAEADNYDAAYTRAFSMSILESQWKLGVKVNKSDDYQTIENTLSKDLNVKTNAMSLPMNKVCEYEQAGSNGGVILYVLWQVATFGNQKPEFEEYLNCE